MGSVEPREIGNHANRALALTLLALLAPAAAGAATGGGCAKPGHKAGCAARAARDVAPNHFQVLRNSN
jgi:hypothetical protein